MNVDYLGVLLGEFLMELPQFAQEDLQFVCWWQDGHPGQKKGGEKKRKGAVN